MKKIFLILCLTIPLISQYVHAADLDYDLNPETIIKQIESKGARKIVKELYDNGDGWNLVLNNIGSGHLDWINVALKLLKGTDAGATSMLEVAMFIALEKSPNLVLEASYLNNSGKIRFPLNSVCSSNFLIDYPLNPESLQMVINRKKALERISDIKLEIKKNKCISLLNKEIIKIQNMLKEKNEN